MVFDMLENTSRYTDLNPGFAKAFEFLARPDLPQLPVDTYEIDGERVFAIVIKGPGRDKEVAQLEMHQNYIDIQVVLAGTDTMGWKPLSACSAPIGDYDPEADVQLFHDEPETWLTTNSGAFAIFFPEDAHLPMVSAGQLHKVVVKVAV